MAEDVVLKAQPRTIIGKQVSNLRRSGGLPAIIYGKHVDPLPITLDAREAGRILPRVTPSQLITISVDGKNHTVLLRDRQRHPVKGDLLHADFLEVSLTETLRAEVPIVFEGEEEAPAVKNQVGILLPNLESLLVEALPRDLPERITVDVSGLQDVGDAVYVRDLPLPAEVTVLQDPDLAVIVVSASEAEAIAAELEAVEAAEVEAEPEVIERGKKEEEEEE